VVRSLRLENAFVLEDRIEELSTESWGVATTRALGNLGELIGSAPFLSPGGLILAWTTEPESLAAGLAPHFRLEQTLRLPASKRGAIALLAKAR
jgi:hypothetical protein